MNAKIVLPLAAAFTVFAFSAQAQGVGGGEPPHAKTPPPAARPAGPRPPGAVPGPHAGGVPGPHVGGVPGPHVGGVPGPRVGGVPPGARVMHTGPIPSRTFAGHAYRGHVDWEGGRWHHQVYNGRMGWWWDVGGVWYFYPQRFDGPPAYISEDYVDDVAYDSGPAPVVGAYAPPPGAYPPPPPPPPDPGASAVGGASVGGVLGGLLTGRASGAAAGAVIGGLTGATAAAREGYWLSNGGCYYRYPSGQYVVADPRWCY
jgi:hypothetical protein